MSNKLKFSLTQIEYVLAVHKHGHFAKAADACFVTQPTLSMQIQKLEEELGTVIFDRSKKPILLTDSGQKIIEQFRTVLAEAKKIQEILERSGSEQIKGRLSFGVIPTIAPYLLPRLLPVVANELPELELDIQELQTHQIIDRLNNDELDVGLLATPLKIAQIHEHALYYEPFQALIRRDHELASQRKIKHADLKSDELWLLTEGHCLRTQILDVCSLKDSGKKKKGFRFESGSLETLKNLIDSYGGYTLLPQMANANIGKNTVLLNFDRPIPAREIGLVYRRKQYKVDLIEHLAECILNCIPAEIRKIRPKDLEVIPV